MKKVNPRRVPATMADVKKAKKDAVDFAVKSAVYMMLYVLVDKHNATEEELQVFSEEINYIADSVAKGYLDYKDIERMLEEEYGVIWALGK